MAQDEDHPEVSPLTRLRDTVRSGAETVREAASSARGRDDLVGGAARAGEAGTQAVRRGVASVGRAVDRGVSSAAKGLTLGDYRREVDEALAEAAEVIAAQAVRIAALEEQLRAVTARAELGAGDDPTTGGADGD